MKNEVFSVMKSDPAVRSNKRLDYQTTQYISRVMGVLLPNINL